MAYSPQRKAMRELSIVIAFLALLLTGCGANTATETTRSHEATTNFAATGSTQPETTARTAAVLEETTETTTEAAPPPETRTPDTVVPAGQVTAIGDSVMKGAVGALQQEVPNLGVIDVQGSLQAPAAIGILRQRRAAGQLGDVVVVHIGNNGSCSAEKFDEMMEVLAGVRKVLVVNMTIPHGVNNLVAVPNNACWPNRYGGTRTPCLSIGVPQVPAIPNPSRGMVSTSHSKVPRPTLT